eukprot:CAMPEP_0118924984 /NCGR_PEP_ID=MMETSP1169-20130426/2916_1 /TAXON_ID=36882 /ORGANISM="Pyramimonas obovata, Strain CCMP722" /LENGTH=432 /DNA_ID=CAMNT_0006866151 /DNA_START=182 /DNA_END=1477 /DNA_ORIENTATION=-
MKRTVAMMFVAGFVLGLSVVSCPVPSTREAKEKWAATEESAQDVPNKELPGEENIPPNWQRLPCPRDGASTTYASSSDTDSSTDSSQQDTCVVPESDLADDTSPIYLFGEHAGVLLDYPMITPDSAEMWNLELSKMKMFDLCEGRCSSTRDSHRFDSGRHSAEESGLSPTLVHAINAWLGSIPGCEGLEISQAFVHLYPGPGLGYFAEHADDNNAAARLIMRLTPDESTSVVTYTDVRTGEKGTMVIPHGTFYIMDAIGRGSIRDAKNAAYFLHGVGTHEVDVTSIVVDVRVRTITLSRAEVAHRVRELLRHATLASPPAADLPRDEGRRLPALQLMRREATAATGICKYEGCAYFVSATNNYCRRHDTSLATSRAREEDATKEALRAQGISKYAVSKRGKQAMTERAARREADAELKEEARAQKEAQREAQ